MILTKLKLQGFRPFFEEATLEIRPDLTVLTGANDAGKSAVLDIVKRLSEDVPGSVDDANIDFLHNSTKVWNANSDIWAKATYKVSSVTTNFLRERLRDGWEVDVILLPTMNQLRVVSIRDGEGQPNKLKTSTILRRRTKIIDLAKLDEIRTEIPAESPNNSENKLLELAFKEAYRERLETLDTSSRNLQRDLANDALNTKLDLARPASLGIEFNVDFASHDPLVFQVNLRDRLGSLAPLHVRGVGNQKLTRFMFSLLTVDVQQEQVMIVYDEPESSLHADGQHAFRRVLESIAEGNSNTQVIFATHSPAMINPSRPESLRLLTREPTDNGIATTRIDNKPYVDGNFQSVRTQLGILAADSLLFSSVTVIVEGSSDSRGLNFLFRRLFKESEKEEHRDLNVLHSLTMFFPAGGYGEFSRWLKFAQCNGVLPILFYDGDQKSEAQGMANSNPSVPVVCMDEDNEFENIVPPETYFTALAEIVPGNRNISKDEFEAWEANANLPPQMMFTKRVARWLKETHQTGLDKPQVMAKAIELVDLDKVCMSRINELILKIRETSKQL